VHCPAKIASLEQYPVRILVVTSGALCDIGPLFAVWVSLGWIKLTALTALVKPALMASKY
jgi:hypothetical protein